MIIVSGLWCAIGHYMGSTKKINLSFLTLGSYFINAPITFYH